MSVRIDIFSGFLGAGKTMLIKKLLTEKAYGRNTVIIENEFGEVGIDGQILRECNIEIKEINSGCICCQVSGNFGEAVMEIVNKYSPDNLIIEPSGVAKLSEILNILKGSAFQNKLEVRNIFTLVDIRNYDMYLKNFKEFYEDQIRKANKIVLSRSQLVDSSIIQGTIKSLKKLNSKAEIIFKPWDKLNAKNFLIGDNVQTKQEISLLKSNVNKAIRQETSHNAKEIFESYPIDVIRNVNIEDIKRKFEIIDNNKVFGNVVRAKGVVKGKDGIYYQFDYVPKEFKSRIIKWSNLKVISIIGSKLNKMELIKLFSE